MIPCLIKLRVHAPYSKLSARTRVNVEKHRLVPTLVYVLQEGKSEQMQTKRYKTEEVSIASLSHKNGYSLLTFIKEEHKRQHWEAQIHALFRKEKAT